MSMLDWILGAEAFFATGAAMAAVRHAEAAGARTRQMRRRASMWHAIAKGAAAKLTAEREANLFATRLHRPRASEGAQETTEAG